ncbi:M14 family metallopeptidase [Ectothiorhodospira variabilis]|uniref:M14 family metallopeptidase n=1 Tax=Ectothiorhodospira variabilis TaxID=505694 RepID=UPI001EFB8183|nr:M14 family metallopeptidase [Ectothiorhodospira variabilis]MCG5496662.1 M14 family metallopeptidase [Ectothiorhodospira variabilis]
MLKYYDTLPEGFTQTPPGQIHELLPAPTLIHLQGRREPPLFISVLLHGNEPVGLQAVQALLQDLPASGLPRSLYLFVGNVQAAAKGVRRLPGQPDFNRVWPGTDHPECAETDLMRQVVDTVTRAPLFASVDVHNNTGLNPHYACVNRLDNRFLQLATLFGRTVVYFIRPRGVQSMALAAHCPAVTLECGKPEDAHGIEHARDYLHACLNLADIPDSPVAHHDLDLFHTVAQVKVPDSVKISFTPGEAELIFDPDLDHMNFRELPSGTVLARVNSSQPLHLLAHDEQGVDVTPRYFETIRDRLVLTRRVMPSMLTLDETIIRQDCLCYLMERMAPPASR